MRRPSWDSAHPERRSRRTKPSNPMKDPQDRISPRTSNPIRFVGDRRQPVSLFHTVIILKKHDVRRHTPTAFTLAALTALSEPVAVCTCFGLTARSHVGKQVLRRRRLGSGNPPLTGWTPLRLTQLSHPDRLRCAARYCIPGCRFHY